MMNIADILNDVIKEKQKKTYKLHILKKQFLEMGLVQDPIRERIFLLPSYVKKYLDIKEDYFFEIGEDSISIFKNGISEENQNIILDDYHGNIKEIISRLCGIIFDLLYEYEYIGSVTEE